MNAQDREEIGRIVEAKLEEVLRRLLSQQPQAPDLPAPVTDFQRAKREALADREKKKLRRLGQLAGMDLDSLLRRTG